MTTAEGATNESLPRTGLRVKCDRVYALSDAAAVRDLRIARVRARVLY